METIRSTDRARGVHTLMVVLLVVAWSSTFAAIKLGLEYCPPLLFAGLRALLGGAAMAAFAWRPGMSLRWRTTWPTYLLLAFLNVVLFLGLQTVAIMDLPTGMAAVLLYLQPVLTGLLAWPVLGESLSVTKMLGLLLGFAGIVTVSWDGLNGDIAPQGVAIALVAAVAWAFGTVLVKRKEEMLVGPVTITVQFVIGGAALTALGLVVEGPAEITWVPGLWVGLGYSALVGTTLAWALWFWLIRAGEASRAAAFIFFVPLSAIAIGAVLLDEQVTPLLAVGAALVVAGIILVNRRRR
ncbi:MAG TPA: DMT family transporter [Nocardioidaceae bacterium]|nr:DMT family transporter [Nocardioidaceae bacterium]